MIHIYICNYHHTTWYATKSLYAEMLEDCQRESEEFELYMG